MDLKKNISISENGFLFDATTGESYSVNGTASDILNLMKEGKTEAEIKATFIRMYAVDDLTFERNYYEFTSLLQHLGLMR